MGAGGLIAAIGVGLGAAFLLSRREQQVTPAATTTNACDQVPAGYARDACNALKGVGGILKGIGDALGTGGFDWKAADAKNKSLNGAVEVGNPLPRKYCTGPRFVVEKDGRTSPGYAGDPAAHVKAPWGSQVAGSVLRFSNGCVPVKGAPGWEKCAPGTASMLGGNVGVWDTALAADVMTGHVGGAFSRPSGDPTTGYFTDEHCDGSPDPSTKQNFPIPVPTGHVGFFYRGKPFTCPPGTRPDFSVRHVGGAVTKPPCRARTGYQPGATSSTPSPTTAQEPAFTLAGMGALVDSVLKV